MCWRQSYNDLDLRQATVPRSGCPIRRMDNRLAPSVVPGTSSAPISARVSVTMSFFTDRDLECLARLKANWRQFYCGELKRLQNEDADKRWSGKILGPHHVSSVLTVTPWSSRSIRRPCRRS